MPFNKTALYLPVTGLVVVLAMTVFVGAQSGWDDDTHGRNASPDYDRVFAQDVVKRLDIQITAADWDRLIADMTAMAGAFGVAGGGFGGFNFMPDPAAMAACQNLIEGSACSFGDPPQTGRCTILGLGDALACTPLPGVGNPGRGGGAGGGNAGGGFGSDAELLPRTPIYIPARILFDEVVFNHVGLRLKGNSSLVNSWRSGVEKLPFRLNFDELEAQHPEILDQTFFGFPNLNLTSNSQDQSFLRAKVVGDLFRDAGLPAARTAFVRVFFDRGQGAQYLGLYTLIEVPDQPFLQASFGSDEGNLYKPAGNGARLGVFDAADFPKKTNRNDEDWTDVQDLIAVLNESRGDAEVWRRRLEARFGVSSFLRWLALNTLIGNSDTYGGLAHNYWLYGSPRHRDRMFFIPWDHDLAMNAGGPGGGGGGAAPPGGGAPPGGVPGGAPPGGGGGFGGFGGGGGALDLFNDRINASWPLIRYLMDDPTYRAAYRQNVEELLNTVFEPSRLAARLQTESARITPYVVGPQGEQPGRTYLQSPEQFTQAVASLLSYAQTRPAAARQALSEAR